MAHAYNLSGISVEVAELVSLICFLIASACILQVIVSKINEKIPISIIWFLYGMLTYGIAMSLNGKVDDPLTHAILNLRHIDNSVLYYIVLPILLYEATQEINWYAFKNFIIGGIALSVFGVFLQVIILGVLFHYTILGSTKIGISISFLIASIISSTDPIAVLAILNGVSAPPKLSSIFNAESLINDGSSVLLFQFFYLLTLGDTGSAGYYVLLFFKLLILSPLLGILMAIVVSIWISTFHAHHFAQCVSLMIGGYISYFLAEYTLNISGPLTIVCYGIFIKALGIIGLDREAHDKHRHFLHGLSFIANSVVFIISGVITLGMIANNMSNNQALTHITKLCTMYLYINAARILMILIFMPLLEFIGYGINWKELILLVWGGLRGSIVLVLALRIERDTNFNNELTNTIAFYISGSVFLILVIQGFTFELIYRLLNPYKTNPFRKVYLEKVMKIIHYYYTTDMKNLENYWLFKGTDVVYLANELVPKLTSMKWSSHGLLQLNMPSVSHIMNDIINEDGEFVHKFYQGERGDVVGTMFKSEGQFDNGTIDDSSADGYISLFTQGLLITQGTNIGIKFNPKLNLRLLERATTNQSSSTNIKEQFTTLDSLPKDSLQQFSKHKDNGYGSQEDFFPERQSTDVTIIFDKNECNLGKNQPTYTNPMTFDIINKPCLTPILSLDIEYSDVEALEDNLPNVAFDNNILRKEREGELYIMVFNACKQMYKTLYDDGYIGGGTLLSLQSILDISSDFALKKLKHKSIKAWDNVLKDCNESYVHIHNWLAHSNDIHNMDGFEFEWLALKRILSSNFSNHNIKNAYSERSTRFNEESNNSSLFEWLKRSVKRGLYMISSFMMSLISRIRVVKYELEMLVAFVDSHQRILMLGGSNFEKLLGKDLLSSFIKQLRLAQLYMRILIKKYPEDIKVELIRIASFMLIRIKSSIVRSQVENGLLLSEDSDRILSLLSKQCYVISKYSAGIFTFTAKSFSLKALKDRICCRSRK
ncbi:solute carrier family 9, member 6 [Babesia microti strain RI]|uniref:Solute carrier family 9, member 6 n=1 Tax=Babesia microti (strain RI) TaxID=1133968 RepID=A0A1R4AAS5_BABMR|nr:solute carrier family 9, member 6 [Babesia microti strain RI]SJK86103.1 solute carrier family 9, member 6 [Babesia microti strain RI]|eukprot:XP_021338299.1 solute carrier family 9, member 6 [Babesia microti strain RI]